MILFTATTIVGLACVLAGCWLIAPSLFLIVLGLCLLGLFGLRTVALYGWYGIVTPDAEASDETP